MIERSKREKRRRPVDRVVYVDHDLEIVILLQVKFRKSYASAEEEKARYVIFAQNLQAIE
jgi:hypothetical protein